MDRSRQPAALNSCRSLCFIDDGAGAAAEIRAGGGGSWHRRKLDLAQGGGGVLCCPSAESIEIECVLEA